MLLFRLLYRDAAPSDDGDDYSPPAHRDRLTEFYPDRSRTVVTENDSPDVGFRFSLNPYCGCEHGCAYCYARPTHEFLGISAGLDFETRSFFKEDAPVLLRGFLARRKWRPEPIAMSGVTDPYQPAERRLLLTRRCLEVAADCCQPISVITRSSLVLRDLDILGGQIAGLFRLFARRHGLDGDLPPYDCTRFRPPPDGRGQGWLF